MTKLYTIHIGSPPPQIEADNAEEAIVLLRQALEMHGTYLDVPFTALVTAEDFEQEVTA